jgi:hypothetical protein
MPDIFVPPVMLDPERVKDFNWLISYPRSGNTWLRLLLANYLFPTEPKYFIDTDYYVPDSHQHPWELLLERSKEVKPFFLKSHYIDHLPYRFGKCVYLYRDGRDVAVSYYYFEQWRQNFSGTFSEFLRDVWISGDVYFGSWRNHVNLWVGGHTGYDVLLLDYQDLYDDTKTSMKRICDFCSVPYDEEKMEIVIERLTFSNLGKMAEEENVEKRKLGLTGGPGAWKNHFTQEDLDLFRVSCGDAMETSLSRRSHV